MAEFNPWTTNLPFHDIGYKDCSSFVSTVNSVCSSFEPKNEVLEKYIAEHYDDIQEKLKKKRIQEEEKKKNKIIEKNKRLRQLVKHVHFSGNTCIVYWNDGTQTKSHWNEKEDFFDPEKAILVCMARKLYENTGIYNEVIKKYASLEKMRWIDNLLDFEGLEWE